jgi:hypothetical protein
MPVLHNVQYYLLKFFVCLNRTCNPLVFPTFDLNCLQFTCYVVYYLCVEILIAILLSTAPAPTYCMYGSLH